MQGWRITMEDAHAAVLDLHAKYTTGTGEPTDPDKRLAFFGVYDGHGGDKVALFAGENLHQIVAKQESFANGDIEQSLKDGFLATDRAILEGSWRPRRSNDTFEFETIASSLLLLPALLSHTPDG